jgi:hypothetical protein
MYADVAHLSKLRALLFALRLPTSARGIANFLRQVLIVGDASQVMVVPSLLNPPQFKTWRNGSCQSSGVAHLSKLRAIMRMFSQFPIRVVKSCDDFFRRLYK